MTLEKPQEEYIKENKKDDDFINHEKEVANGEVTPKDRLENQIRLATLLYGTLHDKNFDVETHEGRNRIMEFWTEEKDGEKSFSECYRNIEEDDGFTDHPRFKGNIYKITIQDVIYYKENKRLPEE